MYIHALNSVHHELLLCYSCETQVHFILKDTVEMKDRVSQLSNLEITRYSEVSYAHKQKKLTIE